jgi:hypothetical protein
MYLEMTYLWEMISGVAYYVAIKKNLLVVGLVRYAVH